MRFLKFMAMVLPLILAGCFDSSHEDSSVFYPPAPAYVPSPPIEASDLSCPVEPCLSQPSPEWHPTEGDLIYAGQLVMELKRNHGGEIPSHAEMLTHIEANMNLTPQQAEMILDELDI